MKGRHCIRNESTKLNVYTKNSPFGDKKNFLPFRMAHCLADLN